MENIRRIPNLFIIGAPKCGTTAMSSYLAGHPDIFMSEEGGIKEPKFFCSDRWYAHQSHPRTWDEYLRLFEPAPADVRYLGEATPRYLQSKVAVPDILEYCENPCFIIMLRNPVDVASSQHNQRFKTGEENKNFEEAWQLQKNRMDGINLPPGISDGEFLHYANHAMFGQQIQRLLQHVSWNEMHCIFFEDFKKSARDCYGYLLEWLNLPADGCSDFTTQNASMTFRSKQLETALQAASRVRKRLGIRGLGVRKAINRVNTVPGREPIRPEFRRELQDYFKEDIQLLAELTGRNLSHWYAHE
jgi:hypothetical protein